MSIRKHILKHINEANLLSLDDEISFDQSENTINKAANDGYLKMLYDFKNCKPGDLLYYHHELGFNLVEGRKEFGDNIHIYGRCILPYDGKSVTFTFLPYLDYPSEKTWYAHIRSGNFWARHIYNHTENLNYKFSIRMASYDIFEKIYNDKTGLLNRGGYPDDSEFGELPLIRNYGDTHFWCDQTNPDNPKEAALLTPMSTFTVSYGSAGKVNNEIRKKYVSKSEKFEAIYTITFTFPKIRKSLLKESTDFNSLLQIDNDIEFEQSKNSAQKITKNIKEWNFIQENFVDLDLPSGTLWGKHNLWNLLDKDPMKRCTSWYGKLIDWGRVYPNGRDKESVLMPNRNAIQADGYLPDEYDAACVELKDKNVNAHMPTSDQIQELIDNTNHGWVKRFKGIPYLNGIVFSSLKDDNKFIFIPAAGYRNDAGEWMEDMNEIKIWSKNNSSIYRSACILFASERAVLVSTLSNFSQAMVRPVIG